MAVGGREKVLLVDRDPYVRRLVTHFLGDLYVVEVADDGYLALDRVRAAPPTAVITEVMVPRLDGLALCRLLKSDPKTAHVPILVLSMLAVEARARGAGADGFLAKPLEKSRLVAALRDLFPSRLRGAPPPEKAP